MQMYIWRSIRNVTENYHNSAGVCVLANSVEQAKAMIPRIDGELPMEPIKEPDVIYSIINQLEPIIYIFPDAGCC